MISIKKEDLLKGSCYSYHNYMSFHMINRFILFNLMAISSFPCSEMTGSHRLKPSLLDVNPRSPSMTSLSVPAQTLFPHKRMSPCHTAAHYTPSHTALSHSFSGWTVSIHTLWKHTLTHGSIWVVTTTSDLLCSLILKLGSSCGWKFCSMSH